MDIKKKTKKSLSTATNNHTKSSGLLVKNDYDDIWAGGIVIDCVNKLIR